MMQFAIFFMVLVAGAVVNSAEVGNFLVGGDKGEGNSPVGGDDYDSLVRDDGEYFMVTRNVIGSEIDPLPTRLARSNLNVGAICATCRLLTSVNARMTGISGQVRTQDITFSRGGNRITAIRAFPVGGSASASPRIVAGGINTSMATVRLTSGMGIGYDYQVEFWGQ